CCAVARPEHIRSNHRDCERQDLRGCPGGQGRRHQRRHRRSPPCHGRHGRRLHRHRSPPRHIPPPGGGQRVQSTRPVRHHARRQSRRQRGRAADGRFLHHTSRGGSFIS